jgi:hypothetical protein
MNIQFADLEANGFLGKATKWDNQAQVKAQLYIIL